MIDVHAHFAEEGYEFPAEWEKIAAAGVDKVILAADTLGHARMHAEFADAHGGCYFTVGVHPEFAETALEGEARSEFYALAKRTKCVAVGEIGLDYHYAGYDRAAQRDLFVRQIEFADALGLPIQIHSRDACFDTLSILREMRGHLGHGYLMHCYSYGAENISAFAELGAYFSFGGVTCFKNAKKVWESVAACPVDRLLSETDSPYLSPFRGEKNTPANIGTIVTRLAELRGLSFEDMAAQIDENAARLFPKIK